MFTPTHPERPRPISDLAAGLTDLALEVLGKAGVRGDSVEMELELWRALTAEIEREFDRPCPPQPGSRNAAESLHSL